MKAKTILGMIACASACVTLSAFGNTTNNWFSVTAANDAVTKTDCNVTIGNQAVTTATDDAIVLDNDKSTPLVITPSAAATKGDGVVKITGTAVLTPSATNDFEVTTGAKAGFAVGIDDNSSTNFYGYANGTWTKLTGTPTESATTFALLLDYRVHKVSFYVNDTLLAAAAGGATSFDFETDTDALVAIDAFGSGSITSIDSKYEVAVAIGKDAKRYGSVAEAVNTSGNGIIQVIDPDTGAAAEEQNAANGLKKWECDALNIAEDGVIPVAPAAGDTSTAYVTLAAGIVPEAGLTVTFDVYQEGVQNPVNTGCAANAIQIPVGTGKFTVKPVVTGANQ
jgi:hypothetical protein